jgi:hypothetical protein
VTSAEGWIQGVTDTITFLLAENEELKHRLAVLEAEYWARRLAGPSHSRLRRRSDAVAQPIEPESTSMPTATLTAGTETRGGPS